MKYKAILKILCLIPGLIFAKESDQSPVAIGNFALPVSQQPGPLVSFGQNILEQGLLQLFLFGDAFIGNHNYMTDLVPGILYAFRDDLSLFVNAPFSPGNKDHHFHSSGIEDVFAQLEYAFYTKPNVDSTVQATVVGDVIFPTGSVSKTPRTGFGSTSFFIGTTWSYMKTDWFLFTSPGVVLTTPKHRTKIGNQLLYQWGLGRNISGSSESIWAWMVEFTGQYIWKDKIRGRKNRNSGGNVIFITPSLWFSTPKLIFQLGAGYPVLQHLYGKQSKTFLSIVFNAGMRF